MFVEIESWQKFTSIEIILTHISNLLSKVTSKFNIVFDKPIDRSMSNYTSL